MKRLCALLISATLGAHTMGQAAEIKPDPSLADLPAVADILAKSAQVYRELKTYRDEGTVETKFDGGGMQHGSDLKFTTAFSRTGDFRFEFESRTAPFVHESKYVIWRSGSSIKSWWSLQPDIETHANLGMAIAAATGVSNGTAYNIPSALMADTAWKGRTWTSPSGSYRVADGSEAGVPCFRVQVMTSRGPEKIGETQMPAVTRKSTIWIAKETSLLLRIDDESDFGRFFSTSTTRYKPVTDSPVPPSAFEFGH